MGKAYTDEQKITVKGLLELGRDEETIEKETGVSDRTIRRWKLELERTGRIGKPPEARTGRHRVLNPEIEGALTEYVKDKPDMSVDDMLWWLYDNYKIVVGTRTIRRVFERKGELLKPGKSRNPTKRKSNVSTEISHGFVEEEEVEILQAQTPPPPHESQYQSPYPPLPPQNGTLDGVENQLRRAMQPMQPAQPMLQEMSPPFAAPMDLEGELPEDEETIQLQLQQIALQRREVDLRLKLRRLHGGKGTMVTSSGPSTLYNPEATAQPPGPKRDSRSKKKIQESKKRTADRQERMLRDLERRSRRRDHLTAEWVLSKDIWPLRAQGMLADLMHTYACYSYSPNNDATFEAIYRDLYQLVDLSKGDWDPQTHDELLRERMKRKMGQLRTKMQKTGEIVNRTDGFSGFQKAEDYTGEAAGQTVGDESELPHDPPLHGDEMQAHAGGAAASEMQHQHHHHQDQMQQHPSDHDHIPYDSLPDEGLQQHNIYPNPMLPHQGQGGYALMDQHANLMPYASLGSQQGLGGHESMVM